MSQQQQDNAPKAPPVAPPQDQGTEMKAKKSDTKTEMVAKKKVTIQAIKAIRVGDTTYEPGQTVEVSEEEAEHFCKPSKGRYNFGGERAEEDAQTARHDMTRAKRVEAV